ALCRGHIGEGPVAVVVEKEASVVIGKVPAIGDKQIEVTVVVVVSPNGGPGIRGNPHAELVRHVSEGSIAVISVKAGLGRAVRWHRTGLTPGDIHIDVTVVIIIAPGDPSATDSHGKSGTRGHVDESSIALVVEQC